MVTLISKYFLDVFVTEGLFQPSKTYMSADDDQFYIEQIVNGDTTAFAILVNRYKNLVFSLALRMLRNREEAEEVSQDIFIKIYGHLANYKGDSKFSTWIYRIAYNACLDRIKTYKRQYDTVCIDKFTENQIGNLETAYELMERSDRQLAVKECINRLVADDSVLITLFYFEELSLAEISKIIGIDKNNVKIRLFRARKRLATILKEQLESTMLENYGQRSR